MWYKLSKHQFIMIIALVEFSAWRFCRDIRKKTDTDRHTDRKTERQTHRPTDIQELWKHLVTPNYWHYIRKVGIGRGCLLTWPISY